LLGTPYLEIAGDLIISCKSTGSKAVISFKEGSSWGGASSRNKIQGKVMDSNGKMVHELVGKWDESVDRKIGKDNFERLWEIKDFPSSEFSTLYFLLVRLTLTWLYEQILVVITDSRTLRLVSTRLLPSTTFTLLPILDSDPINSPSKEVTLTQLRS